MIKTFTAYTAEVDNVDIAVGDILKQLDIENNLLSNSVGFITSHYEFIYTGVVKALCDRLPFNLTGTVTTAQATNSCEPGDMLLTIMVLTSDDILFKTVMTAPLKEGGGVAIREAYITATEDIDKRLSLIIPFAPFTIENSGDEYVKVINEISGGVPCFGTLAVDDSSDFRECFMIYNGEHYKDRMSLTLFYGNISPKFYIATISSEKILKKEALITSSDGHILKELNGRPLIEFFEDLGLEKVSQSSYSMSSFPFMLDYGDGTPLVSKVFVALNENNYGICAGAMPEGSTLYMGIFDKEDVLKTTREAIQNAIKGTKEISGILIYACVARNISLAGDVFAELNVVKDETKGLSFMMAYSGGEICPTYINNNKEIINRFHNNSFVVCVF